MYTNRLQEYTQKLGISLSEYRNRNEGFTHAPKFRSCVLLNGKNYVSRGTFVKRKEAEQDAAKVALENITETRNVRGKPRIQDPTYCKYILFDYAVKMYLKIPEYSTTGGEQMRPVFVSTLDFDGKVYKGEEARSKKIAEQLAARVAIRSLLDTFACFI
ncbi:double-stranded RNA-binding protein 8-like [Pistacia vera]|uniref:double-stranded RNA-binding protein 8-like n=1 Tax=Pistacia vera TaxID=55513 RepID=UPI001263B2D6|nr:double-stranded RNA-binding protein 8-like [Pistacia vera]